MTRWNVLAPILLSTMCLGLADCHFSAYYAVYDLEKCPSKAFKWPSALESNSISIARMPHQEDGALNTYECKKQVRYRIVDKANSKLREYENYASIRRAEQCQLILSSGQVGPRYSGEKLKEMAATWGKDTKEFVQLLMKATDLKAVIPAAKVEYIGGKDEYAAWCQNI